MKDKIMNMKMYNKPQTDMIEVTTSNTICVSIVDDPVDNTQGD